MSKVGRPSRPAISRFMEKVSVGQPGECWPWTGGTSERGYGKFRDETSRIVGAHIFAYRNWKGPLGEGEIVRHTCDNPPCVNPEHLIPGTSQNNTDDSVSRGRRKRMDKEKIAAIRESRSKGNTLRVVAEEFDVSESYVSLVSRGLRRNG